MCKNEQVKIFYFEGFGNYSKFFGWDEGLTVGISYSDLSMEEACRLEKYERDNVDLDRSPSGLPETVQKGVFPYFENSYAGSRNIRGFIIASDREEAKKIVSSWIDEHYPIVEYQRD